MANLAGKCYQLEQNATGTDDIYEFIEKLKDLANEYPEITKKTKEIKCNLHYGFDLWKYTKNAPERTNWICNFKT